MMTLEQILHKLTELYYEAKKLDNDSATAISTAEDTVIKAIKMETHDDN
jgi:hypothetical protein